VTLSYDKDADVLYVTFEQLPAHKVLYIENENGDILRLDRESKRVVGCTIPAFSIRCSKGRVVVPEVGPVPFNEFAAHLLP
jgi:hypothetical protein